MEERPSKHRLPARSLTEEVGAAAAKGGAALIPLAGGVLAEGLGLALSLSLTKRRDDWLRDLEARLRELEQRVEGFRLDDLGQNEQFVSAAVQATQMALRTHQAEKLGALQNCLLKVAVGIAPQEDQQLIFLQLIDRFSPTHIHVLRHFQSGDQADLARFRQQRELTDQVVRDLHDSGLLRDTRPYAARNRDMDEALVIYGWEVTNLGKQFLDFIKAPQKV